MRVNLVDTEKKQLTHETSLAKFGVDTTENGPSEGLATSYLPRPPPPLNYTAAGFMPQPLNPAVL